MTELLFNSGAAMSLVREEVPLEIRELSPDMPLDERKATIREYLKMINRADDVLGFWQAELLFEVENNDYYKDWEYLTEEGEIKKFETFDEFCRIEFGFNERKVRYFKAIYAKFVVELQLPIDKLRKLEWTKLREITSICSKENVNDMLEAIDGKTVAFVKEFVRNFRQSLDNQNDAEQPEGPKPKDKKEPTPKPAEDRSMVASMDEEGFMALTFTLPTNIYESAMQALDIAGKIAETTKRSAQLDTICQIFMSGIVSEVGKDQFNYSLEQAKSGIERAFGVELEVV